MFKKRPFARGQIRHKQQTGYDSGQELAVICQQAASPVFIMQIRGQWNKLVQDFIIEHFNS